MGSRDRNKLNSLLKTEETTFWKKTFGHTLPVFQKKLCVCYCSSSNYSVNQISYVKKRQDCWLFALNEETTFYPSVTTETKTCKWAAVFSRHGPCCPWVVIWLGVRGVIWLGLRTVGFRPCYHTPLKFSLSCACWMTYWFIFSTHALSGSHLVCSRS